ncbi:hypothetical protein HKBW3S09_00062, partial [Candidatus Hakubella thermalkaliphila]
TGVAILSAYSMPISNEKEAFILVHQADQVLYVAMIVTQMEPPGRPEAS